MNEVWKTIPGYEGRYEVSNWGRVLSKRTNLFIKPNLMDHGYVCVHLYSGGKHTRTVKTIHQLVAQAFIANPFNCGEVNHKNFLRRDNRVENLRPANDSENRRNAKKRKNNTSGYKNVYWCNKSKKWTVILSFNKVQKRLGTFKDLELAGLVATEARDKYHKEFANHL